MIGDGRYGGPDDSRLALHAMELSFEAGGFRVDVSDPPPAVLYESFGVEARNFR